MLQNTKCKDKPCLGSGMVKRPNTREVKSKPRDLRNKRVRVLTRVDAFLSLAVCSSKPFLLYPTNKFWDNQSTWGLVSTRCWWDSLISILPLCIQRLGLVQCGDWFELQREQRRICHLNLQCQKTLLCDSSSEGCWTKESGKESPSW